MADAHAHPHTHDGIDWTSRLAPMRRTAEVEAPFLSTVAERLVALVPDGATVADIGPGAGGMSAALATALGRRGGGRIVLVDAVPELLSAAAIHVREVAPRRVEVDTVLVDVASEHVAELLPEVDLMWASRVVHHLPDQQKGIEGLAGVLAAGGWLAVSEGGLLTQCLPWDVGVGEPGFADRLAAAHRDWFADMRAAMPGATRLPVGWTRALADAGLTDVSSFSYLIDLPAPAAEQVRLSVVDWLTWCGAVAADRLDPSDQAALLRLLDQDDPAYIGLRDDVFILGASTVHLGRKAAG